MFEITEEGSSRTDEYRASVDFAFDCDWKTGLLKLSRSFFIIFRRGDRAKVFVGKEGR